MKNAGYNSHFHNEVNEYIRKKIYLILKEIEFDLIKF